MHPHPLQGPQDGALHPGCLPEGQVGAREEGGSSLEGAASMEQCPLARSSRTGGPRLRSGRETQSAGCGAGDQQGALPLRASVSPQDPERTAAQDSSGPSQRPAFAWAVLRPGTPALHRPEPPHLSGWAEGGGPRNTDGGSPRGGRPSSRHRKGGCREPFQTPLLGFFFFRFLQIPRLF